MFVEKPIYIQNNNSAVRNKSSVNNFSSDICIFSQPTFSVSGTNKILLDIKDCDFNSVDFDALKLSAETICLDNKGLDETCLDSVDWKLKIIEDSATTFESVFKTLTSFSGSSPTNPELISEIKNGFNSLEYVYSESDGIFTIEKPFGVGNLRIDLCVVTNYNDCVGEFKDCGCPPGFIENPEGDGCIRTESIGVETSGVTYTASTSTVEDMSGATFYANITTLPKPIQRQGATGNTVVVDGGDDPNPYPFDGHNPSGTTLPIRAIITNSLWIDRNQDTILVGTDIPATQFAGFSKCIDISQSGTYSVGVSAFGSFRVRVNGDLYVALSGDVSTNENLAFWHVFEINLNSGLNIIEMETSNMFTVPIFGAEIYSATTEQLTGMTTEAELSAVTIFTTMGKTGNTFDFNVSGNTCPPGYSLDNCSGSPVCTKIEHTGFTECQITGSCEVCNILCEENFSKITVNDDNVYIVSNEDTQIDLVVTFTGNVESFTAFSSDFRYEIYKFDKNVNQFRKPAIIKSDFFVFNEDIIDSELPTFVLISDLEIDGEYLIKGFFKYPLCTLFLKGLDLTNDTSAIISKTDKFGFYESDLDWYFVVFKEAQTPKLLQSNTVSNIAGRLIVFSTRPISDDQELFPLATPVNGDIIINVNGLTLTKDEEYELQSSTVVKLLTEVLTTDIITIAYISDTTVTGLKTDIINVGVITSGATGTQGNNVVFFNTTENKYEIYTSVSPSDFNDLIVTLNGSNLTNGVDYYQSITNSKRIILNGELVSGDIIEIFYIPVTNISGDIFTNNPEINWFVDESVDGEGKFIIEITSDDDPDFESIIDTFEVQYIIGESVYSKIINLSGEFGDEFLLRIKNEKRFTTVNGDILTSSKFSETIKIKIATNAVNSY